MAKLTGEQIRFLTSIGLSESDAFDGTGLNRATYKLGMLREDKLVAFGVIACGKGGHTLRWRSGHCAQCNPLHRVFQERYETSQWLYLAYSRNGTFVKIGITKNINKRTTTLCDQAYGGYADWSILSAVEASQAGEVEHEIHSALIKYRRFSGYWKNYQMQVAGELFNCSVSHALLIANKILARRNLKLFVLPAEFME
jgi:hypothetical protein